MRTKIHFTHMDRSESVENHAVSKIEKIVTDFGGRPDYHLQVWLVSENPKLAKGAPLYKCEVSVRFPPKKEVFVQKSSEDMYDAINFAASANNGSRSSFEIAPIPSPSSFNEGRR